MRSRLRNLLVGVGSSLLLCGCMIPQFGGSAHADLDVEMLLQFLDEVDYIITTYGWLLPLLGL